MCVCDFAVSAPVIADMYTQSPSSVLTAVSVYISVMDGVAH